ncbi:hypothetical protein Tco_0627834 [Tanacetum coccineum]|uniref:Uncharacterized protein n=1 Tax=Tanacetum coccineum TaxID=301880 RepID=A0ABQ4WNL2_9ASTR
MENISILINYPHPLLRDEQEWAKEKARLTDLTHQAKEESRLRMVEPKAAAKLVGAAGLVIGTMAVASSSSKEIVDFASQLKKAGELVESIEKNLASGSTFVGWLEAGIISAVVLGAMLKAFRG